MSEVISGILNLVDKGCRRKGVDMKVLIIGSGGREHAIAMSAAKSSKVEKLYLSLIHI